MKRYPASEQEFNKLKSTGMLWEFFPKTGDTFASFKIAYPEYEYTS